MDRPVCGTCPFWWDFGDDGFCRRHAPRPYTWDQAGKQAHKAGEYASDSIWPRTSVESWCGEHPDFPAYVASLPPVP